MSTRYQAALNRAMDWIGANLAGDTSLDAVARIAGFSSFHFHRVFMDASGETLHAFVTRLRFERAVALLRSTPRKSLTNIALESGFGSSSSLSRAFAQRYSVKPSELCNPVTMQDFLFRNSQRIDPNTTASFSGSAACSLPSTKRLGAETVRIEYWPVLPLAYVRVFGSYLKPDELIAAYRSIEDWADQQAICRDQSRLIGMSIDDPSVVPLAKCRYDFCRETSIRPQARSGVSHQSLPATAWAILPCNGDLADVDRSWTYLFRDWLPSSGWQPAPIPALEVFHRRPEEIGWERYEIDCCLPLEPLSR